MTDPALLDAVRRHEALEARYATSRAEAERERGVVPDPASARLAAKALDFALTNLGDLPRPCVVWFAPPDSRRGWFRFGGLQEEAIGLRNDLAGEDLLFAVMHETAHYFCWRRGLADTELLADAIGTALLRRWRAANNSSSGEEA